ncbi:hypothetical protein SADUNF_Sadunf06G0014200 [Salix dunnii]|uniref:HMA domain-containing protein n=1 Tax=Salix dunnii TaxID=1413687 RepID=A0A835MWH2_9ROSI|nr:hypothetical protein SADUNF_Sadunf06G0014200 [Salix dunnii]
MHLSLFTRPTLRPPLYIYCVSPRHSQFHRLIGFGVRNSDRSRNKTMVETQVTTMVIKVVDLGCEKCRKKIKKLLCKIPQIQSQIYVEKENTVTITVACCSPEKIKRKILCKGCGFIECVEIKPPEKKPPETKPPEKKPPEKKPPPPIKHEFNVTIENTCRNECNGGSCGPWCHCHLTPPPPCVPCRRPPWEDGCWSCRRRGYLVCRCEYICEDYSSPCTVM